MATALVEIDCDSLWQKLERGDAFVLVDALSPIEFAASHLPGAVNISPQSVDGRAERLIPGLDTEVVVYCLNPSCDSSVQVAERLVELGYRNVLHFSGGKQGWREGGLPLEGGRV